MSKPDLKPWPQQLERYEAPALWYATSEEEPNGEIRVMFELQGPAQTFAQFGPGTMIDLRLNRYSRASLHQSTAFNGPLEPDGLPKLPPAPELCNDCAFLDHCPAEGECIRTLMQLLDIEATTPIDEARELIADAKRSAIIEPPSAAELRGEAQRAPACEDCPWPMQCGAHCLKRDVLKEVAPSVSSSATAPTFTRAQIRMALREVYQAQADIKAAVEADSQDVIDPALVAMGVLDALPEAIAFQFGLNIRGACAECDATLFKDEPYTSNAEGKPTCEAHAAPDAA